MSVAIRFEMCVRTIVFVSVGLLAGCKSLSPASAVIRVEKVVDLSYSFGPDTIYWPTAEGSKLQRVALGRTEGGYFYYANNISGAEHGGTHMDAPMHFAEGRITTEKVPLANCSSRR